MDGFTYIFNAFAAEGKYFTCGDARAGDTYKAMKVAAENDEGVKERVRFYDYRTPEELYDNKSDPDALLNLMNVGDIAVKSDCIREVLVQWMKDNNNPLLSCYQDYLSRSK